MSNERDNRQRVSPDDVNQESNKNLVEEKGADPLDFVSPKQVVDLPSQGDFYPSESPLQGASSV